MPNMKPFLLSALLLSLLSGCNPSHKAEQTEATHQKRTEVNPETKRILETDLSELEVSVPQADSTEQEYVDPALEPIAENQPAQEEFDIKVYRAESQGTMSGYIDKIDIISLNDSPTSITGILVNRGNCAITRIYDYNNMRYGSVALAYPRCKAEYIREVSISTANGTYAYRIQ
ncbi:hypothetical protein [Acinetobacter sp. NIPH 2100]|uniref:hypothetical protein n=1 Tax=Acinetobacter sp. NIPH 2100 TaxID=1217708 RepID=UPI0002CEA63F|nr:hypothetical protein [Acinetobacter sp. NIPH 2100]ENX38312.1 hypothetical protein F887_03480 [Acinetobacter sp. NIPH 2100]